MRTDRFLDQVSLDNLHNGGYFGRGFGRFDVALSDRRTLRGARDGRRIARSSWPISDRSMPPARISGRSSTTFRCGPRIWAHRERIDIRGDRRLSDTTAALLPSAGDTPVTAAQDRRLDHVTVSSRYNHSARRRICCAPASTCSGSRSTERFTMGLTSPTFNVPGDARLQRRAAAVRPDARRLVLYAFDDAQTGTQLSAFVQSTARSTGSPSTSASRHDEYRVPRQRPPAPAAGRPVLRAAAGQVVLRASYNRNYQTPPNENLLLSNSEAASQLAPASVQGRARQRLPSDPAGAPGRLRGRRAVLDRPAWSTVDGAVYRKVSTRSAGQQQLLRHRHHLPDDAEQHRGDGARSAR